MQKLLYLLAFALLFSCAEPKRANSESDSTKVADNLLNIESDAKLSSPKSLAEIKQVYAKVIQSLQGNQLDSVTIKYNCNGERSGSVTYFSQNGDVRLVKHQYNEYDHFSATDQYFVIDKKVFFAHFNHLVWSFEANAAAEGATKDDVTEQRIYIVNDKAIECLEKKYTIRSKAQNNPKSEDLLNKKITCKPLTPTLKDFQKLLDFQSEKNHDCLN